MRGPILWAIAVFLLLAAVLFFTAGCALRFDAGISIKSTRPDPKATPAAQPAPSPTTVSALLEEYRTTLDDACTTGVMTAESCVRHRARLVAIQQAENNRLEQRIEAQRAAEDAAEVEHPHTRGALVAITHMLRSILGRD